MSQFAMNSDTLIILWLVSGALLAAYLMRKRKRKMF